MPFAATNPLAGYLGPGVVWTGDLSFEGRLRIDGTFRGRVYSDHTLEVGPAGLVDGQIDVHDAVVSGTLRGKIRVRGKLLIEATGHVEGDLVVGELEQRRGARVKAHVTRSWSVDEEKP